MLTVELYLLCIALVWIEIEACICKIWNGIKETMVCSMLSSACTTELICCTWCLTCKWPDFVWYQRASVRTVLFAVVGPNIFQQQEFSDLCNVPVICFECYVFWRFCVLKCIETRKINQKIKWRYIFTRHYLRDRTEFIEGNIHVV